MGCERGGGGNGVEDGEVGGCGELRWEPEVNVGDDEPEGNAADKDGADPHEVVTQGHGGDGDFIVIIFGIRAGGPQVPADNSGDEIVHLFGHVGVEVDLVEEEAEENDTNNANGPGENVASGRQDDCSKVKNGTGKLQPANLITKHVEGDICDAEEVAEHDLIVSVIFTLSQALRRPPQRRKASYREIKLKISSSEELNR